MVEEEERLLKVGEEFLRKPTDHRTIPHEFFRRSSFRKNLVLLLRQRVYIYIYGQTSPLRKEKGDTSDVNIMGIFDSGILVYR